MSRFYCLLRTASAACARSVGTGVSHTLYVSRAVEYGENGMRKEEREPIFTSHICHTFFTSLFSHVCAVLRMRAKPHLLFYAQFLLRSLQF